MAVINIDDAYILNETGAQVDKVTGLYFKDESTSAAEKAFAQLNIGTAGSNRNLLDNPWFTAGNVVNQRGFSSMASASGYTYTVDRWMVSNSKATLGSDDITIEPAANDYGLIQRIEASRLIANETYTLSVIINGTLYTRTFVWNSNKYLPKFYGTVRAYINSPSDNPVALWIVGHPSDSFTISKIKLELGSVSTLANDTPPEYGTELAKCQRYFVRVKGDPFGTGYITSSGSGSRITIPTSVPMRGQPSVSFSGTFHLRVQGGTVNVTGMSSPTPVNTAGGITLSCTGFTGASVGYCALCADGINDYIDFSADL